MNRVPLFQLSAVLTASALLAACGKATNGTCEEANDCAETQDATTPPPQGNDATSPQDASDDATVSPGDDEAGQSGDSGSAGDANTSAMDAAACPGQKLCNEKCVGIDDPNFGCTSTSCSPCVATNATAVCTAGACALGTCESGFAHCTGSALGCETSITTTSNCGTCTTSCDAGFLCSEEDAGTAACTLTCPGSAPTNCSGSCVDLNNSNQHCGSCSTPCTNPSNGTSTCTNKTCIAACNTNYHLCPSASPNTCYPNADLPTQDVCEISETYGVFVSFSQGTDGAGSGSRATPYKTIGAGLTAAATAGKRLYVCAESYAEAITLKDGVDMFGYFTCTSGAWAVGTSQATVAAPTSPAVTAMNLSKGVRVEGFAITAPNVTASGASSIAVFAVASSGITFVNDALTAGSGAPGANGAPGTTETGTITCTAPGDSANGTPSGAPGAAGQAGYYSSGGFTPGPQAGQGGPGSPGDCGGAGATGAFVACSASCSAICCKNMNDPCDGVTGGTGLPGTGGEPGSGGLGGSGGGASITIFSSGSVVTVTGGKVVAGAGGAGGKGGAGGPGGAGAQGATGKTSPQCDAQGGAGGPAGGMGGSGAPGGGGAGGDSYCAYTFTGQAVNLTGTTTTMGTAGPGGMETGGNTGPAGALAIHN